MSITQWPADDRPREKLLKHGAGILSDAELLAIFLRTGVRGKSAVDLARELLLEFGSLSHLLAAEQQHFLAYPGLGMAKYVQLQAVLEMARRHFGERLQQASVLSNPEDTRCYLMSQLQDYPHEVFACLFLDNRHRVIRFEKLFQGTIDAASVYPREVARKALTHNAAAVIFAHNHPSGHHLPSDSDLLITAQLKKALALLQIRVLDHIIIGKGDTYSLAENGQIR